MSEIEGQNSEEDLVCPLCAEPLDSTDRNFYPCTCGYQLCMWCYRKLLEQDNSRCPQCRQEYKQENIQYIESKEPPMKDKNKQDKKKKSEKSLHNVRVIQRNLVYIIGLPPDLADEDTLKSEGCCGQYGQIIKVVVNRTYLNMGDPKQSSCSAYVTFKKKQDAYDCIMTLDGFWIQGRMLRASFGTTKYCNFFLRGQKCTNPDCLYLHALGSDDDSFTKEEMQSSPFFQEQTHPGRGPQPQKIYEGNTLFPPPVRTDKIIEDDTDAVEYGVRGLDDVSDSDSDNNNNNNENGNGSGNCNVEINWLNDEKYNDPNKDDPMAGWGFSAFNVCLKYLNDLIQEEEENNNSNNSNNNNNNNNNNNDNNGNNNNNDSFMNEDIHIINPPIIDLSGLDEYILPQYPATMNPVNPALAAAAAAAGIGGLNGLNTINGVIPGGINGINNGGIVGLNGIAINGNGLANIPPQYLPPNAAANMSGMNSNNNNNNMVNEEMNEMMAPMYVAQNEGKIPEQYRYNVQMNRGPPINMMNQSKLGMSPIEWDAERYQRMIPPQPQPNSAASLAAMKFRIQQQQQQQQQQQMQSPPRPIPQRMMGYGMPARSPVEDPTQWNGGYPPDQGMYNQVYRINPQYPPY